MSVRVVIPVKAPEHCKTRLRGVLGDAERRALVARMLRHVVTVARATPGIDQVMLVGPSRHDLPETIGLVTDPGGGLNAALAAAARAAHADGFARIVFLSADLPLLTGHDVAALIADGDEIVIGPDRYGTGTNALSLGAGTVLRFAFGPGSFDRHRAEAARLGLALRVVLSTTLGLDIDLPDDLDTLAVLEAAGRWS